MNKQELIKRIGQLFVFGSRDYIERNRVLDLVEQLDEPQPVQVPQFVAEHIEHSKEIGRDLQDAMNSSLINKQVDQWLYTKNNMETFARAWLDGYEVEEEKRYLVKIRATKHYISKDGTGKIFFSLAYKESFTKKELEEAGFGWVFDCPGIDVEEVE